MDVKKETMAVGRMMLAQNLPHSIFYKDKSLVKLISYIMQLSDCYSGCRRFKPCHLPHIKIAVNKRFA